MAPPKLIGPDLTSQSAFNVNRARIGVRGANFPLDGKTNYFLLVEFGNNALTNAKDSYAPRVSDASITLNHIKGARVRMGLFKYPGSEEGLQGIGVLDYINFTEVSNQMMLERTQSEYNVARWNADANKTFSEYDRPVGAFRDVGIQVFDTFQTGGLETSYALMIGNGNGVNFTDNNDDKDVYAYLSTEKVFGGKGGRREGLKGYAWYQAGKRSVDRNEDGSYDDTVKRQRWGVGATYLKKPFRVMAEYMKGENMIFAGPDKPDYQFGPSNGIDGEAKGYYLDVGYYIPGTKWELDARYDWYNRFIGQPHDATFKTVTLGAQYHVNKKTRITANYAFRSFGSDNATQDGVLDGVKGRAAIQITAIY